MERAERPWRIDKETETSLISKRKLQPNITIGFAEKSPRFVAKGRHTVVFEEYKEKEKTK